VLWIIALAKLASNRGYMEQERSNARDQVAMIDKLQSENDNLNKEIRILKDDLAQLVEGRLPGLLPLEFDITIPIEQDYIRSISFIMTGTEQESYYAYHAVMHNGDVARITPDATLFMFDERGIQVGKTILSNASSAPEVENSDLRPGETRYYSNQIKLDSKTSPKYFLIEQ
jgi:hypothetical protein